MPLWLYGLQQILNALQVSAFYALLAVAYVLLHGVSNRFNLSFGAIATWAGYAAAGTILALLDATFWDTPSILGAALGAALLVGGALGTLAGRRIVVPLMRAPTLATLVATLGLGLALEEAIRISTGSRDLWLQPLYAEPMIRLSAPPLAVHVTVMQALVLTASMLLPLGLGVLMRASRLGREWRACADDPQALALMGVDVRRLVVTWSVISCLLAGAAGFLMAVHYGNITFANGFMLAMKALFVAILGGLRSIRGAVLGALAVGFAETAWSGFVSTEYRDVAVFVGLTALLVLRMPGHDADRAARGP